MLKLSQGLKAILKPEQVTANLQANFQNIAHPLTHKFWPPKTITERCRCSTMVQLQHLSTQLHNWRVRWTGSGINSFICNSNWHESHQADNAECDLCMHLIMGWWGAHKSDFGSGCIRLHSLTTCQPLCHSTNNPVHPLHYSLSTSPNDIWHMENPFICKSHKCMSKPQNSFHGPPLQPSQPLISKLSRVFIWTFLFSLFLVSQSKSNL